MNAYVHFCAHLKCKELHVFQGLDIPFHKRMSTVS
jgi:hypothetical protein